MTVINISRERTKGEKALSSGEAAKQEASSGGRGRERGKGKGRKTDREREEGWREEREREKGERKRRISFEAMDFVVELPQVHCYRLE